MGKRSVEEGIQKKMNIQSIFCITLRASIGTTKDRHSERRGNAVIRVEKGAMET